ncbi:hypothetical protein ACMYSP_04610 [Klebsiella sp. R390]|uniref:hypothetical protein n=1 Tax=Klebsiella sp. R390 TaxID=2755400 RepID=UPI003DA848FC
MNTPAQSARISIIIYSLGITSFLIFFLILSPAIGMRFDYSQEQNLRLIDIVLPTFFGYLGAASHFLFNANRGREIIDQNAFILKLLIHGPFLIFIISICCLFFTFYTTHRPLPDNVPRVYRMDFNSLSRYLSICLALLAATVGIISSYLFGSHSIEEK